MKLVKFYHLKIDEINELSFLDVEDLWDAITVLEAQDMLLQMKIADYPNMKKSDREKLFREMHKQAYPSTWNEKKSLSHDEIMRLING